MAEGGTIQALTLRYSLTNVEPVYEDEKLVVINTGSYGRILKVMVNGALCAAKEIHYNIAVGPGNVNVEQFTREIELMSGMRHPNVVQFLGVCPSVRPNAMSPLQEVNVPWLIMEYLPFELHSTLEKQLQIPLSVKVAIMLDISRGLSYLHNNRSSEEIIHRDLSARNVLLTSSLSAKLADFGVSKRRDYNATMTKNTGNPWFMPPENKPGSDVRYNTKMDIFSFGVILLFIIIEKFPDEILLDTYHNDHGNLLARSEVERRQKYFDIAEGSRDPDTLTFVNLCKECLDNRPEHRPSAENVLNHLNRFHLPKDAMETDKLQLMMRMRQLGNEPPQSPRQPQETGRREEVAALQAELGHLREQLDGRTQDVERVEGQLSQLRVQRDAELQRMQIQAARNLEEARSECHRLEAELESKEGQLADKQRALEREKEIADHYQLMINYGESEENRGLGEQQKLRLDLVQAQRDCDEWSRSHDDLVSQLQTKDMEMVTLRQQLTRLNEEIRRTEEKYTYAKENARSYAEQLHKLESKPSTTEEASLPPLPPSGLQTSLRLSCSRQEEPSPRGLHSAHCVHYKNKILYGGGEQAAEANYLKSILAFDLELNKWSVFSAHLKLMHFALLVVAGGRLLMVGGYDDTRNEYTDKISEFVEGQGWREFCRLPGKLAKTAVLAYRTWLIVAGGCTEGAHSLSQVHALDLGPGGSKGWKSLAPLPESCQGFQCASYISQHRTNQSKDVGVWYLTSCIPGLQSKQPTMAVSVPDLVTKGAKWLRIPDPPVRSPAVTTLRGHLLILGGQDAKKQNLISTKVYMYHHGTKEWLSVAEVKNPRSLSTCVSMHTNPDTTKFMVLGGKDKRNNYSTTVEIFNCVP